MHLTSLFATAVAIIPLASAVALHTNGSYLESDTYAARAWINQQDYQRNGVPRRGQLATTRTQSYAKNGMPLTEEACSSKFVNAT